MPVRPRTSVLLVLGLIPEQGVLLAGAKVVQQVVSRIMGMTNGAGQGHEIGVWHWVDIWPFQRRPPNMMRSINIG